MLSDDLTMCVELRGIQCECVHTWTVSLQNTLSLDDFQSLGDFPIVTQDINTNTLFGFFWLSCYSPKLCSQQNTFSQLWMSFKYKRDWTIFQMHTHKKDNLHTCSHWNPHITHTYRPSKTSADAWSYVWLVSLWITDGTAEVSINSRLSENKLWDQMLFSTQK